MCVLKRHDDVYQQLAWIESTTCTDSLGRDGSCMAASECLGVSAPSSSCSVAGLVCCVTSDCLFSTTAPSQECPNNGVLDQACRASGRVGKCSSTCSSTAADEFVALSGCCSVCRNSFLISLLC